MEKTQSNETAPRKRRKTPVPVDAPVALDARKLADSYYRAEALDFLKKLGIHTFDVAEFDPPAEGLSRVYLTETFRSLLTVLKENAWLLSFMDPRPFIDRLAPLPVTVQAAFWIHEAYPTEHPKTTLSESGSTFWLVAKGTPYLAREHSNVYSAPSAKDRLLDTEKPLTLYSELFACLCTPGSTIIAPFLGSGNILIAAARQGLHAVGCDSNPLLYTAFTTRLSFS